MAVASTVVQVTDDFGFAFPHVHLAAQCDDGEVVQARTDANGQAQLPLTGESCWLAAMYPDWPIRYQPVDLPHESQAVTVVISEPVRTPLEPADDARRRRRVSLTRWGRDRLRVRRAGSGGCGRRSWSRSHLTIRPTRNGTRVRYRHRFGPGHGWWGLRVADGRVRTRYTLSQSVWQDIVYAASKELPPGSWATENGMAWASQWAGLSIRRSGVVSTSGLPTTPLLAHAILNATVQLPSSAFDPLLMRSAQSGPHRPPQEGSYTPLYGPRDVHLIQADGTWQALGSVGSRIPCTRTAEGLRCTRSVGDVHYAVADTLRVDFSASPPVLAWKETYVVSGERSTQHTVAERAAPHDVPSSLPPKPIRERLRLALEQRVSELE